MADLRISGDKIVYIDSSGNTIYAFPNELGLIGDAMILNDNGELVFGDIGLRNKTIGEIGNVDSTADSPEIGQSLIWNGTTWIADSVSAALPEAIDSDQIVSIISETYIKSIIDADYIQANQTAVIDSQGILSFIDDTYIQTNQSYDALTLDGELPSYYLNYNNLNNKPNLNNIDAALLDGQEGSYYLNYNNLNNKPNLSNIDAALLDGQEGSYYLNYNNLNNKSNIDITQLTIGNWKISVINERLTFSYNDVAKVSIDYLDSGIISANDVTAFGVP